MNYKYTFSKASFNRMLNEYNKAVQNGEYKKDIPYFCWRKLKEAEEIIVTLRLHCEDNGINDNEMIYSVFIAVDGLVVWSGEKSDKTNSSQKNFVDFFNKEGHLYCDKENYDFHDHDEVGIKADVKEDKEDKKIVIDTISWGGPKVAPSTSGVWIDNNNSNMTLVCDSLDEKVDEAVKKAFEEKNKEKEKENNMKGFNFDFGPCTDDNIRMSVYGLAVKNNNGNWVSYNSQAEEIVDVDILNFDGRKFMFKMPVALNNVAVGDIVIHNRVPMFVMEASESNKLIVVDVRAGEQKIVIPTVNMFGFNFITKVVSLLDMSKNTPTPDAPFGNMLPFLLMNDGQTDKVENNDMLMMMLMSQGMGNFNMIQNPMMMYFLMKDDEQSDMLPLMMMMNMNQQAPSIQRIQKQNEKTFIKNNIASDSDED